MTAILSNTDTVEPEDRSPVSFGSRLAAARPALLAFARRIAREDAEDLCQDTLARALRYRESFDAQRPLLPWLRVCLMRESVDQARQRAPRARELEHESEPQAPKPGPELRNARRVAQLLDALDPLDARLLRGFHSHSRVVQTRVFETTLGGALQEPVEITLPIVATMHAQSRFALDLGQGLVVCTPDEDAGFEYIMLLQLHELVVDPDPEEH